MFGNSTNQRMASKLIVTAGCLLLALALVPSAAYAGKKKPQPQPVKQQEREPKLEDFDLSKIVFPNPPAIARIRTVGYFIGQKIEKDTKKQKPKSSWMDKLAGSKSVDLQKDTNIPFQLIAPSGMAIDSKGWVYAADYRVGAIFVFNPETKESELIKNHSAANFKTINGVAIDDSDRLFVSDSGFRHILVFDKNHKVVDEISGGLVTPNGLAVDDENRQLYVADTDLDQVLVYDLDSLKLKRKIGTAGKNHELTDPGNFAWPTGVAVDDDGNLYVADTLNDRIEIFDPDGKFISAFGRNCDGPGCFQRPKGVAVDSDGHIWVVDTMMSRVQAFAPDGQLLISFGAYGKFPGQFGSLASIMIDKNNRIFTSEMQPGRIQIFRYVTDAEAEQERARREEERQKKAEKPAEQKQNETAGATTPPKGGR